MCRWVRTRISENTIHSRVPDNELTLFASRLRFSLSFCLCTTAPRSNDARHRDVVVHMIAHVHVPPRPAVVVSAPRSNAPSDLHVRIRWVVQSRAEGRETFDRFWCRECAVAIEAYPSWTNLPVRKVSGERHGPTRTTTAWVHENKTGAAIVDRSRRRTRRDICRGRINLGIST